MKQLKLTLFVLAAILFGCQEAELVDPNDTGAVKMKTVTISAGIDDTDTKASLDSQTGAFTWQSGDLISVLATDGNFYDFILEGEYGSKIAEFVGNIPAGAEVTTVATYPRIVADGTANTVLTDNTLNYVLPAIWNYAKDVSNVPMVATFGEGAGHMSFKQVGGVMRFPVKNLPPEAQFVMTMADKTITGSFPVDITTLGEGAMVAGAEASVLTINYSSDVDGAYAEFNVPVPTGTYNNFKVEIKDAEGNVLLEKNYSADNTVNRATLLNMKELVLPDRPMATPEVWPFFVDARVVFNPYEGVTDYAFYIDGADTPVILAAEDVNGGKVGALVGGNFSHNTTHKVAVAKVIDGTPVAESKSVEASFTTGRVMQVTNNTGTKFISAGWDDVAIGKENSTAYDESTKKWSVVVEDGTTDYRKVRGYRVQLYAEDKTTLLYDEIPSNSQIDYGGSYAGSSWLGQVGGEKQLIPTAISFGWLEPGKKYYFRVQTLAEPVVMNSPETGCFEPNTPGYTVMSQRGGCGWSEFVEMTTDVAHVASENEILYEGFDDMMYNGDIMNASPGLTPQILTGPTDAYLSRESADLYKAWAAKPFAEREFTTHNFSDPISAYNIGLTDDSRVDSDTPRYLNEYAGSLEGWAIRGAGSDTRGIYPQFGAVRLGQSANATGYVELRTPALQSDKLSDDTDTKCIVTVKVSTSTTDKPNPAQILGVYHYRGDVTLDNKNTMYINLDEEGNTKAEWTENYTFTDADNYMRRPTWFEVSTEMNLRNGDIISFDRPNVKYNGESNYYRGFLVLGEIKIEVAPEEENEFVDNGVGTEPDDTNYDVYGLGEFPISHWYTVEPWSYKNADGTYNDELTKERYQEMKDAGINIALYMGHSIDCSIAEQKRILGICEQIGLKFIGQTQYGGNIDKIPEIKEHLAPSDAYIGDYIIDEPKVSAYESFKPYVDEFRRQIPDKEVYINLFPQYANAATQLGTDYENYIDQYLEKINTKALSYDFYGLGKTALNTTYYTNLDLVRSKTLGYKKPFWVITQAGQVGASKMPTELEQRWTVWSTIALGSKGISYFCYWTPSGGSFDEMPYMIDLEGNKTEMYDWVKKINADINTIGKKLLPCHADGAIMSLTKTFPLFDNNSAGRTKYGPVRSLKAKEAHLVCGCFRDARKSMDTGNYGGYKVLVTHEFPGLNLTDNFTATLNLDPAVTEITVTCRNTEKTLQLTNTLNEQITVDGLTFAVTYDGANLVLSMPEGEAMLVEF